MERALQSLINWWEVSGIDVPEIKPAPKSVRQRNSARQNQNPPPHRAAQKAPLKAPLKASERLPSPTPKATPPSERIEKASAIAASAKSLDALKTAIESFDAGSLSDAAREAVFARGNPNADIMVIGEAPGREEDQAGKPFVGRSGQLLDKIFASIGLSEDTLYMTNVCNWHLPGGRNPEPDDIAICLPFIRRHIELQAPKTIVLVGGVAMSALTDKKGITKSRGDWVEVSTGSHSAPTLILYHPAYLLRRPEFKRETWRDILALRAHLDGLKTA